MFNIFTSLLVPLYMYVEQISLRTENADALANLWLSWLACWHPEFNTYTSVHVYKGNNVLPTIARSYFVMSYTIPIIVLSYEAVTGFTLATIGHPHVVQGTHWQLQESVTLCIIEGITCNATGDKLM